MGFLDFLLPPKVRARKARRERRHALRDAEIAVDGVKEQQKRLEKDAAKHLAEARAAKQSGDKAAANRALVSARAALTLAMKLEQKRWVFEQFLVKLQVAQSDETFAGAMAAMTKVGRIDPERVADVFDAAQEQLGEAVETDKFWSAMYSKEMEGAKGSLEDYVPSLDELDRQTDAEAAADLGAAPTVDAALAEGRDRVKRILEGK